MKAVLLLSLVLIVGCGKIEMAQMKKQTDADVIKMVNRYKQAGVTEVDTVLNDYLALADEYERKGWGRYGAPGWIDELRGTCEARLAVFHKAIGNEAAYQTHVRRAIQQRKRAYPDIDYTEEDVCGWVERLDEVHIKPKWRDEVSRTPSSGKPL